MAKRSRRPVRPDTVSSAASEASASSSTSSTRSTRSPRPRRAVAQPSLFERYRTLIYGGAALVGVLIIAWLFLLNGAKAGYICASEMTPGPSESITPGLPTATPSPIPTASATPSPLITTAPSSSALPSGSAAPSGSATPTTAPTTAPTTPPSASPSAAPTATPGATATAAPSPTARLGFPNTILGRTHILDLGTVIKYAFCPPTSGEHYNIPGHGPIRPAVYPANEEQVPGGWVHNLEHGYIVALYRCPSGVIGQGDCISQAEMDQMQTFFSQVPDSGLPSCPTKVVVARFDSMTTKFALLAWGRALLTDTFDLDTALLFDQQWQDQPAAPEHGIC